MLNVSNKFLQASYSQTRELALYIQVTTMGGTTYKLTNEDVIQGTLVTKNSCFASGFELGNTIAGTCAFSLKNFDGEWDNVDFLGATVRPYSGYVFEDGTTERVLLGTYIVDTPTRPQAIVQLQATDYMLFLDTPVNALGINLDDSADAVADEIASKCNVTLDQSTRYLLRGIPLTPLEIDDETTARDVIGELALRAQAFATFNNQGLLSMRKVVRDWATEDSNRQITKLAPTNRISFVEETEPVTITGLKLGEELLGTDDYAIQIEDSIFEFNNHASVFNQINGYTYSGYKASYYGNPAIEVGDYIENTTRDGKKIRSIVGSYTFKHGGNSELSAQAKSPSQNAYKSAQSRKISKIVSNSTAEIKRDFTNFEQSTAQMTDTLSLLVGTYPTTETLPDGSQIRYWHNKPTLAESDVIWKFNGEALGYSTDGGQTYGGFNASTDTITAMIVNAMKISAEQIYIGTESMPLDERIALITGRLEIIDGTNDANYDRVLEQAKQHAEDYADAQANAEQIRADAYADNILTSAEHRAVLEAEDALIRARQEHEQADAALQKYLQEQIEAIDYSTYIQTTAEGDLLLGKNSSRVKTIISNDGVHIGGSKESAFTKYIDGVTIVDHVNTEKLSIGKFTFNQRPDGGLTIDWEG